MAAYSDVIQGVKMAFKNAHGHSIIPLEGKVTSNDKFT